MTRHFALPAFLFLPLFVSCITNDDVVLNTFGSISGAVTESKSVSPLAGVRVSLTPTGSSQVTGQDGTFLFDNLEVQEYTVVFDKDGFRPVQQKVSVKPGMTSMVSVSMTPLEGSLVVTPSSLAFGETLSSAELQLRNLASEKANYTATASNGWISVSPSVGTVAQSEYVTVLVSRSGLSPGSYEGSILFKYSGESLSVPVTMRVPANDAPVVSIESVTDLTASSAALSANLVSTGTSKVAQMGFCWSSVNELPTLSDKSSNQGDAESPRPFNATITGLNPSTTYYCRAYARNTSGVAYSSVLTFTTTEYANPMPEVTIGDASDLSFDSVKLSAALTSTGTTKVLQKGFCWSSVNGTPTLSDKSSNQGPSDAPGEYSATVTGLQPTTTYYCRAYAKNSAGIAYSDVLTFTTTEYQNPLPEVSAVSVTEITDNSAALSASLASIGTSKVTQKGFCWSSTNGTPTLSDNVTSQGSADGPCSFSCELAALAPETMYWCRAYATNASGTVYGEVKSFTTEAKGDDIAVPQGLIAYYTFDEENADDITDNAMHGRLLESPDFITDTPSGNGKSLRINGLKNQSMQIPYVLFKNLSNFSVALWIKDFTSGILLYGKSSKSVSWDVPCIYMGDDDLFYFAVYSNTYGHHSLTFSYPYTAIQSSSWHHLVFTCSKKSNSSNATLSLYVDGKFVDTGEASFTNDYNQNGITNIVIGGDRGGDYRAPTMKIDNLRFYSRALTKEDAAGLYNAKQ